MFDPSELHPDDRILFLGIPDFSVIADCAVRVSEGVVVAMGDEEAVRGGRRAARDLENVMFVPTMPDHLPWGDGFFTRVIDLVGSWPDEHRMRSEIERVTRPSEH